MMGVIGSILVLGGVSLISIALWYLFFFMLVELEELGLTKRRSFRVSYIVIWASIFGYFGNEMYYAIANYVDTSSPIFMIGLILVAPPIALSTQLSGEEP